MAADTAAASAFVANGAGSNVANNVANGADKPPTASGASKSRPSKFRFEYFSPRPKYWSVDGLPIGGLYGVVLSVVASFVARDGLAAAPDYLLWCVIPVALHVGIFLSTEWSVQARCSIRFRHEKDVRSATHVRVEPLVRDTHKNYRTLLVPLEREGEDLSIQYLKKRFIFDAEAGTFDRLRFDVTSPLGHYLASTGLSNNEADKVAKRYGDNVYDIPLPTFEELFKEHAVAPFFVFQLFCVLLWLMDEYWYYSLLTLFMLIVLEAQMVHRRRHDLSELRGMRIPPRPMHVHRGGVWKVVQSDHLLPGDLVALSRKTDVSFPCDVLLLQGSILVNEAMLTGESVPQMKVAASPTEGSPELEVPLDLKGVHKQHIVSAGTTIMLHQNPNPKTAFIKKPPTVGTTSAAVGYVLRTGFGTTQGKLCRTILFSAERITVQSREALHFLMILLAFAIGACCYVLYDGLVVAPTRPDETPRSTFKLVLSVSHIITAVVPPEFPIMLSLAVNLSLVALVQKRIFCTEPFRMPLAGRVETCCFDKTGTLTSDSMEVGGVYGLTGSDAPLLASPTTSIEREAGGGGGGASSSSSVPSGLEQSLPFFAAAVMASCSGLTVVEGEVVGDPLERAALQAIRWIMVSPDLVASKAGKGADRLQVLHRFPFSSELQRMAVVVRHQGPGLGHLEPQASSEQQQSLHDRWLALVKGSCEVLKPRLSEVPEGFDALQERLTKEGFRVLCMGAKEISGEMSKGGKADASSIPREDIEADLKFCGLLALRNAIKPEVSKTVKQLRRSYHRVIMITGDHPLTACQVATQVSMAEGRFLTLHPTGGAVGSKGNGKDAGAAPERDESGALALEWRHTDGTSKSPKPFVVEKARDLTRKYSLCLPGGSLALLRDEELQILAPFVTVFARVSPQQKEQVVTSLNKTSHTIMVGDGTNDVGALKHAHVGISLLSSAAPSMRGGASGVSNPELMATDQAPIVRLGDASIASPFTYKGDSIKCSAVILKLGRATLSTVLMMYKILGLNSVMSAFAMSVLTLDGVKLGDGQTAVESLFSSMLFFMVSRSMPAKELAKQRPNGSVFAWHVLLSLALQLVVHLGVLFQGWQLANSYRGKDFKRDLEGDFEPNLTNSVVFLLMAAMHASSFIANYEGHPFMQPITTNKSLFYSLLGFVAVLLLAATEVSSDLNDALSLVQFPSDDFRQKICLLLVLDLGVSIGLARAVGFVAVSLGAKAAEARAREWGLGLPSGEKDGKSSSKKSK